MKIVTPDRLRSGLLQVHHELRRLGFLSTAFGAGHDFDKRDAFDPEVHLTPYAAHSPGEDFAETFMIFVRTGGVLPERNGSTAIKRKWRFLNDLSHYISRGRARW